MLASHDDRHMQRLSLTMWRGVAELLNVLPALADRLHAHMAGDAQAEADDAEFSAFMQARRRAVPCQTEGLAASESDDEAGRRTPTNAPAEPAAAAPPVPLCRGHFAALHEDAMLRGFHPLDHIANTRFAAMLGVPAGDVAVTEDIALWLRIQRCRDLGAALATHDASVCSHAVADVQLSHAAAAD